MSCREIIDDDDDDDGLKSTILVGLLPTKITSMVMF
jgi:hypothetical protein